MITYQIDKPTHAKINSQIKDMEDVLSEVPNTLQVLLELLEEQSTTISSPSINSYRADLQRRVNDSIRATQQIAQDSQKLIVVSEQAGKHLSAIEEHFGAVLRQSQNTNTVASELVRK